MASTIDKTKPPTGSEVASADVRNNFVAASNDLEGLQSGKAPNNHTHVVGDTIGLQDALDAKADNSHSHVEADVTDLNRARWLGPWSAGTYVKNDIVSDEGWLMIANTTTLDRAAPQPFGVPEYLLEGVAFSPVQSADAIYIGQRYVLAAPEQLSRVRVNLPNIAYTYRLVLIDRTNPANVITTFGSEFRVTTIGDLEININPRIVASGGIFDVLLSMEDQAASVSFNGIWDYKTPNNPNNPGSGEISHASNLLAEFRINKTDDASANRGAELLALASGDDIQMPTGFWTMAADPIDNGTYVTLIVEPLIQGLTGKFTFTFTTYTIAVVNYNNNVNYWPTNQPAAGHTVDGLTSTTGLDNLLVVPEAYPVDLRLQGVTASANWDVMSPNLG